MAFELQPLRRHAAPSSMASPSTISKSKAAARIATVSLCGLAAGITTAAAGDHASRWDGDARSAVRLIAGSAPVGTTAPLRAGVEIRLKSGWHTYWRYPGD